ncbi:MAG: 5,10-methylenetetrahydrofolate reductase [Armatimonadetes bacterium]|nr:5,10-methylenetetrahydrofolate reductase [Armatimonadota bacterium]NIM23573.1 5,10-methylenetetrahydrofolate reductase [Armatimonadota bacterium]NIM67439.1 5,10-methylenetetrahydrofolate reductase [Armatimonadota bacterium]NIM75940.1 5,10-methylenetetrahydrofolate reductase [Armatimonadota bacterium]NIN05625.1 5,10-methylenetetrahydrofolate reductase [Armatimonadota bacterium]
MSLRPALQSDKFVITGEIGPPKGTNVEPALHEAEYFRGRVDGINVTDIQAAAMRLGSMVTCHLLKDAGLEPVLQMVCRDRNRLALQSDLLSAWVLGIENVLCLTGDYPTLGDHPGAKPVFDLDSVQLLKAAKGLNEGHDMMGNELDGKPDFCLGAVVTPGGNPVEMQIMKLEKKVEAGAEFIQTQAIYDIDQFAEFMNKISHLKVPILAGIVLLKSAGMAKYMNSNVAGVSVPEELVKRMSAAGAADKEAKEAGLKADNKVKTSIEIAAELIQKLKPLCRGIHMMPLGWDKHVPPILDAAGL